MMVVSFLPPPRLPLAARQASAAAVVAATSLLLAGVLSPLHAQDSPFGFAAEEPVGEAASETAAGDEPADEPAGPADKLNEQLRRYAASPLPRNLAIAIRQATRLGHWNEVETYLQRLGTRQPDTATLREVATVIGKPLLVRLRLSDELDEAAVAQVETLRQALTAQETDAARLRGLIPQIGSGTVDEQLGAFRGLLAGGQVAIAELAAAAAQPDAQLPAPRQSIVAVLARLGEGAGDALAQLALYGDRRGRAGALETLARLGAEDALPDLITGLHAADATAAERTVAARHLRDLFPSLPGRDEAEQYLRERLQRAQQAVVRAAEIDDPQTVWEVSDDGQSVSAIRSSERLALSREAVDLGARLRRLGSMTPETEAAAITADVGYRLQIDPLFGERAEDADVIAQTWGKASLSASRLDAFLRHSLKSNRLDAVVAILRLIPATTSERLVVSHASQPTLLVQTARHPEPRVRYEAARAIRRQQVAQPYAGSSQVLDRWLEMASLGQLPIALLVEPRVSVGLRIESLLASLGYKVVRVSTVAQAIERIEQGGDLHWLVANARPSDAPAIELVDRVRRHPFGGRLPIIFYGDEVAGTAPSRWEAPLVRIDPPASSVTFSAVMQPILAERLIAPLTAAERLTFSIDGIEALAEVGGDDPRYAFYDLRSAGVESVLGSSSAGRGRAQLGILANLGTPSSQRTLAQAAGNPSLPASYRVEAASAFAKSVARFGTRLGRADVQSQYQRYNQATDPEVRQTLSEVLDAIERQAGVTSKTSTEADTAPSG